jgi:hypothetical protein
VFGDDQLDVLLSDFQQQLEQPANRFEIGIGLGPLY